MKYFMKTKYVWLFFLLCLFACKEEDIQFTTFAPPHWTVDMNGYVEAPLWKVEDSGTDGKPVWEINMAVNDKRPDWNVVDDSNLQYSMTVIFRLSDFLEKYISEDDCIAAFISGECRGKATVQELGGHKLFFLYIKGNNGEPPVSLKYYSARNKRLYELDELYPFSQNSEYGTVSQPEVIYFEQVTKYAEAMSAALVLPETLAENAMDGDILAAFAGTECRGVATVNTNNDGRKVYVIEIRGTDEAREELSLKYYSSVKNTVYKTTARIPFKQGSVYGTEVVPVSPEFLPENSMRAFVTIPDDLLQVASEKDEVAAFINGECVAAGVPFLMDNGRTAYSMVIRKTDSQETEIYFKYYNALYSYMYESGVVTQFVAEGAFGTHESPEILPINMSGKYPFKMMAYVTIPDNLKAFVSDGDELAAFADGDCRGVAEKLTNSHGETVYSMPVIGNMDMKNFVIRYYNVRNQYLYETVEPTIFEPGSEYGTEDNPILLNLYNVQ